MADMNVTAARPGLTPIQWASDFWVEFIRENQFTPYFGTTIDAMIQLRTDLTREPGDSVVFPTVRSLVGAGVTGNTVLEGNEEILNARSLKVPVGVIRHAVAVSQWDEQKSVIDLLNAARQVLKNWAMNKLRADIILSLGAITADADVQISYAAATAAQRNTWLVNNSDRVLFGASKSNNTGVYATSLTNIDNTADKLTAAQITLAKRIARTASPKIRPIRVNGDEEWYVMLVPSMVFRDLMLDPVIINSLQYAWNRGSDNPLFTAGDILYDGVIEPKDGKPGNPEDAKVCIENNGEASFLNYDAGGGFKKMVRDVKAYKCSLPALTAITLVNAGAAQTTGGSGQ